MTRKIVAEKLFRLMNRPPKDEQDIVYALTKIRKLLDFDNAGKRYLLLRVFCNWVLHTKLEHRGAQAILERLDRVLVRHKPISEINLPHQEVFDFISLDLFRRDLQEFLRENQMPTVWVDDMFAWQQTISFYGEEVLDTPLVMVQKASKPRYLMKAVIQSCEPSKQIVQANPDQRFFGFRWEFTLNNGEKLPLPYTFNLAVPPEGWITQGVHSNESWTSAVRSHDVLPYRS